MLTNKSDVLFINPNLIPVILYYSH